MSQVGTIFKQQKHFGLKGRNLTLQVHCDTLPQQCSEGLADICLSDHVSGPAVMYRYNVPVVRKFELNNV